MVDLKKGDKQLIKRINKNAILNCIRLSSGLSRVEISRKIGITTATITNLVNELLEENYLIEMGRGISMGGRKPIILQINGAAGFFAGIYLGVDGLKAGVFDLKGEPQYILSRKITEKDYGTVCVLVRELIDNCLEQYPTIKAIGMGIHGIISSEDQKIIFSPLYGWHNKYLIQDISQGIDLPFFMENDVRAMALAEKWFGEAKEDRDVVLVHVDQGIGSALIINSQLYSGINFGAGEIGHIPLGFSERVCHCGKKGCFEAEAAVDALIDKCRIATGLEITSMEDIIHAMNNKQRGMNDFLEEISDVYASALSYIINFINPAKIILTGQVVRLGENLIKMISDKLNTLCIDSNITKLVTVPEERMDKIKTQGAAALAIKNIFTITP